MGGMAAPDASAAGSAERQLPDRRYELRDGRLVDLPVAARWHTRAQRRLADLLERQGHTADIEVGLSIAPRETRVLDVAAFHTAPSLKRAYFRPGEIALAIEVVSPGSVEDDYVDKPALYARLGIGQFWRVDLDDDDNLIVEMFTLDSEHRVYTPTQTVGLDALEEKQVR